MKRCSMSFSSWRGWCRKRRSKRDVGKRKCTEEMLKTGQRTAAAVLFTIFILAGAAFCLQGCGWFRNLRPAEETTEAQTSAAAAAAETKGAGEGAQSGEKATPGDAALPETEASAETAFSGTEIAGEEGNPEPEFPNGAALPRRRKPFSHRRRYGDATHGPGVPVPEKPPLRPVDRDLIWFATDTHYYSTSLTDQGEAFRERLDKDDGKFVQKSGELLDRFISQAIETRPATVVLSGDLCLDGETANHLELAEKLRRLTEEGICVLVIPGNHDIATNWANSYFGSTAAPLPTPETGQEFLDIYHEFGYDGAFLRDPASLSYIYKVKEDRWLMMLDSAIYEPENRVTGRIRPETLAWMEACFQQAEEAGAEVIPVAHHNLLYESRLFRRDCTLENYRETVDVLHRHGVRLWFSGHLHLQRIRQYRPEPGLYSGENVTEIVNGCFSMYPFPYGELRFGEDRHVTYRQRTVDIPEELRAEGLAEYRRVITGQVSGDIRGVPDYIRANMADSYVGLMVRYVSGEAVDEKEFCSELGYRMMLKYMDGSLELEKIREMLSDTKQDCRSWEGDL